MQRAFNSRGIASRFGELVDKHGREKWLDPLIDELGPYIQLQLGDIANMLEVFNKSVLRSPQKAMLLTMCKAFIIGSHLGKLPLRYLSLLPVFLSLSLRT